MSAGLESEVRRWLLAWARRAIEAGLAGRGRLDESAPPEAVLAPSACFVTLQTVGGDLRGCIGSFEDERPLWRNVAEMAVHAAMHDPRFSPVTLDELADCILEISVLSPRVAIAPDDVVVGVHGLWVERGGRRGVLLPQVPTERGWSRETFLAQTCRKAGLPAEAWRDEATHFEAFTAEVFRESRPGEYEGEPDGLVPEGRGDN
jgi:AmmeMemoRadiSam system protein A